MAIKRSLESEVQRLARNVRLLQASTLGLITVIILMASTAPPTIHRVLKAQTFQLVDEKGTVRAEWFLRTPPKVLDLYTVTEQAAPYLDALGHTKESFLDHIENLAPNAYPSLMFYDEHGDPRTHLREGALTIRSATSSLSILAPEESQTQMTFLNTDGQYDVLTLSALQQQKTVIRGLSYLAAAQGRVAAHKESTGENVVRSRVKGTWKGWRVGTVVLLEDGSVWQQTDITLDVAFDLNPEAFAFKSGLQWFLVVSGSNHAVKVDRLK